MPSPLPSAGVSGSSRLGDGPIADTGRLAHGASGERGRAKQIRDRAKEMRREPTPAENRLWQILRAKRLADYKFKRQLPIDHYIVDFCCLQSRLIIEADGGQHSESEADQRRDTYLRTQGFRILRFWNNDIFENEEGVLLTIMAALEPPLPAQAAPESPSPANGERVGRPAASSPSPLRGRGVGERG